MLKQQYSLDTFSGNLYILVGALETKNSKSTRHDMVVGALSFYKKLTGSKATKYNTELRVIPHANHETAFPTTAIQWLWWLFEID